MLLNQAGHDQHDPQWQTGKLCISCFINSIKYSKLATQKRLILSEFLRNLDADTRRNSKTQWDFPKERNLVILLQEDDTAATEIVRTLLNCLDGPEMDLAADALAKLSSTRNDDKLTEFIASSCVRKIQKEQHNAYESWSSYIYAIQQLLEACPSAIDSIVKNCLPFFESLVGCLGESSEETTLNALCLFEFILNRGHLGALCKSLALRVGKLLKSACQKKILLTSLGILSVITKETDQTNYFCPADNPTAASCLFYALKKVLLLPDPEIKMATLHTLDKLISTREEDKEKSEKLLELALETGMSELLYEILTHVHLPFAECAVRSLYRLSLCQKFVEHRHAIFGVEPLLQAIPFLLETNANPTITGCSMQLLSFILSKHDGNESLLSLVFPAGKSADAFTTPVHLSLKALENSSLPIRMGGASLITSLLKKKHVPLPLPHAIIMQVLGAAKKLTEYFTGGNKNKDDLCDAEAVARILNSAICLYTECKKDPSVSLDSFNSKQPVNLELELEKIPELICEITKELLNNIPLVIDPVLWRAVLQLLIDIGRSDGKAYDFVQDLVRRGFLRRCFLLRKSQVLKQSLDVFLTWFLFAIVKDEEKVPDLSQFKLMVQQIPISLERWEAWLQAQYVAFGSKKLALILLYLIEVAPVEGEGMVAEEQAKSILNGIFRMVAMSYTSDLQSKPLLRSLWFIIAKYSSGPNEASSIFCRLIKWFHPDPDSIIAWLSQIYTQRFCLVQWTLSFSEAVTAMGPAVVSLWISQEEKHLETLSSFCQENYNGLQILCDLVVSEDIAVSCRASLVLERALKRNEQVTEMIWQGLRENVPVICRWVAANNAFDENLRKLNGLVRLLATIINDNHTQQFIDPCIVSTLLAFLPQTVTQETNEIKQLTASSDIQDLIHHGLHYIHVAMATSLVNNDTKGLVCLAASHEEFVTFIAFLLQQMEWKTWKIAARIVMVIAEHCAKSLVQVPARFTVSLTTLITKLYSLDADHYAEILQLVEWVLKGDLHGGLIYDAAYAEQAECSQKLLVLDNLLICLQNLAVQVEPVVEKLVYRCLLQVLRYFKRRAHRSTNENALYQPWTHLCLLLTSQDQSKSSEFQQLAREIKSMVSFSSSWKKHLWARQLDLELLRTTSEAVEDPINN